MTDQGTDSFYRWYNAYYHVYEASPRDYLEKEIAYLKEQKLKMGRRYYVKLMAQLFAAKDVHHYYYDGRIRDATKDATVTRGPMHTGNGRKGAR